MIKLFGQTDKSFTSKYNTLPQAIQNTHTYLITDD